MVFLSSLLVATVWTSNAVRLKQLDKTGRDVSPPPTTDETPETDVMFTKEIRLPLPGESPAITIEKPKDEEPLPSQDLYAALREAAQLADGKFMIPPETECASGKCMTMFLPVMDASFMDNTARDNGMYVEELRPFMRHIEKKAREAPVKSTEGSVDEEEEGKYIVLRKKEEDIDDFGFFHASVQEKRGDASVAMDAWNSAVNTFGSGVTIELRSKLTDHADGSLTNAFNVFAKGDKGNTLVNMVTLNKHAKKAFATTLLKTLEVKAKEITKKTRDGGAFEVMNEDGTPLTTIVQERGTWKILNNADIHIPDHGELWITHLGLNDIPNAYARVIRKQLAKDSTKWYLVLLRSGNRERPPAILKSMELVRLEVLENEKDELPFFLDALD